MDELFGDITCPNCKNLQKMEIPTNSCLFSYKCEGCKSEIKATKSCCVFCDYGDRPCPIAEEHKNSK